MDVKVNDEVIILDNNRYANAKFKEQKGVVVNVARKYFTVEITRNYSGLDKTFTQTTDFAIADGRERGDSNYQSNYTRHAYTPEAYAEKQVRDVALAQLKAFGLEFNNRGTYNAYGSPIPTKKLLAIVEILESSDG